MKKQRLGEILTKQGTVSPEDLRLALARQNDNGKHLGEILLESGAVSKAELASALSEVHGVPYVECPQEGIPAEVLGLVSPALARRCCALPIQIQGHKLVVAFADPQNLELQDEIRFSAGMDVIPRFSFREEILAAIQHFYGPKAAAEDSTGEESDRRPEGEDTAIEFFLSRSREEQSEALNEILAGKESRHTPAVRFVARLLAAAVSRNASDIHIEPRVGNGLVRFRVDGLLQDWMTVPKKHFAAVVSRIKILADMDIAERRVPQDGRFLIQYHGRRLDLRISTLPTHFGEKVVMRILDPHSALITLEQLGLSKECAAGIKRFLDLPQGTLIVTGPTGSGKSTTLYAALNLVRSPIWNIVTVEDPIEYLIEGVNQVQVHPKAGLTFASTLPSILRQDPDIIMIGEIRDGDTAEIVLRAALTGHLVLSTMHTNDSVSAVTRLVDLGVPPYLIAASVSAILAQRLVRRLCGCRQKVPATAEFQKRLANLGCTITMDSLYLPMGCAACGNSGYKGRIGIYELLELTEPVRAAVQQNLPAEQVREIARGFGFRAMQEEAFEKIAEGVTTLEEVLRTVPFETSKKIRCGECAREFSAEFAKCPYCGTPHAGKRDSHHARA